MGKIELNKEITSQLIWDEGYWTDDPEEEVYRVIKKETSYYDLEKGYVNKDIVMLDVKSGKHYQAKNLIASYNHSYTSTWIEVTPYQEIVTKYR